MTEPHPSAAFFRKSVWLGLGVGYLVQLGLKGVLPTLVLVAARILSSVNDNPSLWLEEPGNSAHPVWYALQAAIIFGSGFAGWLAALLSPRRSVVVLTLILLSLVSTVFEQLPRPLSVPVMLIWFVGPCIGILFGWLLAQPSLRRNA